MGRAATSLPVTNPRPQTLHIIEDDPAVRDALTLVLGGEGFAVRPWPDGERFLSAALVSPEDVLLLDLGLPGMNGVELARALRARGSSPRTIVLSGIRGPAFDQAVAAIGPVAAFRKPLAADRLSQAVRELAI